MSISDNTQVELAIQKAQQEFIDSWPKFDVSLAGGIRKGELICATANRCVGKSIFQGMILCHEPPAPINYDWIVVDEWLDHIRANASINCIPMKSSSKQSRYVRVRRK